jgi:xylulose-5-phosphate/fructose-6-phosphate phosphoketolase
MPSRWHVSRPKNTDLTADLFRKIDAYWRGANYLFLGQIYLFDNPLLKDL